MKNNYILNLFTVISFCFFCLNAANVSGQPVIIGNGTAISVFSPLNRTNDYCVYEVIYLASDIGISGNIGRLAFQRVDGTNVDSIENVEIYMQHTSQSQLAAANFSTFGYTLVYTGSFPNDAGSGWREVILDTSFAYDGTNNLMVLVVKGYQPAAPNTPVAPRWYYTNISPSPARARRYYDDIPISTTTALTTTVFTSNARIDFGPLGIIEIVHGNATVFPNPAKDIITFTFNRELKNEKLNLYISGNTGQLVHTCAVSSGESISLQNLENGFYFYQIKSSDLKTAASGKIALLK